LKEMAIKGLTDGEASFPKIGTLRKGAEKKGNAPGRDLNHFRFDSSDQKAIADFEEKFGDTPTEISVLLPYDTTEQVFFTCKEEYTAGGIKHRCDGETVSLLQVVGKDKKSRYQKLFTAPMKCPGGCKEVGRLQVVIPALKRFGYVTAETHSINDIIQLHQQLKAAEMTFGSLKSVPFVLRRSPSQISTPSSDGKRARRESWLLSIEVDPQWAERQLEAARRHQMAIASSGALFLGATPPPPPVLALPAVEVVGEIEEEEVPFCRSEQWQKFRGALEELKNTVRTAADQPSAVIHAQTEGDRYFAAMRSRVSKGQTPKSAIALIDEEERALAEFLLAYNLLEVTP
jgi:hypothetical protein